MGIGHLPTYIYISSNKNSRQKILFDYSVAHIKQTENVFTYLFCHLCGRFFCFFLISQSSLGFLFDLLQHLCDSSSGMKIYTSIYLLAAMLHANVHRDEMGPKEDEEEEGQGQEEQGAVLMGLYCIPIIIIIINLFICRNAQSVLFSHWARFLPHGFRVIKWIQWLARRWKIDGARVLQKIHYFDIHTWVFMVVAVAIAVTRSVLLTDCKKKTTTDDDEEEYFNMRIAHTQIVELKCETDAFIHLFAFLFAFPFITKGDHEET